MNAPAMRDQIQRLEDEMRTMPQIEIPVRHWFADGVYAREITIPAGSVVTGKIHKHEHINIISQGHITVLTENGMKEIRAPFTMISPPGTKRVGWAHEDTTWTTIHGTHETDLSRLEAQLIAKDHDEYLAFRTPKLVEG
jgi:quercetin dioxygenase-like cupin family protein